MSAAPASAGSRPIRSATVNPSMSGIMPSSSTSGNGVPLAAAQRSSASPSGPLAAHVGRAPQCRSVSARIRRLVALSSTTSTGTPVRSDRRLDRPLDRTRGPAPAAPRSGTCSPCPARSRPRSARPSARPAGQMASPSPVPPYFRVVEPSAWVNGSNTACSLSAGMPMPVSATREPDADGGARLARARSHRTTTSPALGELDRVADQVDEHLPQPAGVADEQVGHVRVRRRRPAPAPSRAPARPAP